MTFSCLFLCAFACNFKLAMVSFNVTTDGCLLCRTDETIFDLYGVGKVWDFCESFVCVPIGEISLVGLEVRAYHPNGTLTAINIGLFNKLGLRMFVCISLLTDSMR